MRLSLFFLAIVSITVGHAEDKVIKQDGSTMNGQVVGVSGSQVQLQMETGTIGLPLADIKSVEMPMPAALAEVKNGTPEQILAVAEPLVEKFKGLPADWVVQAMVMAGNAYAAQNNLEKSSAVFAEIKSLYGNSSSSSEAAVGMARLALQQGKTDDALTLLQPLIEKAQQTLSYSPSEGLAYGSAFLLQGQALQARSDAPGALEAYLKVDIFSPDPSVLQAASQRIEALHTDHAGLTVP